jgi:hypothetical protein
MARGILSAEPNPDGIAGLLSHILGRNERWIRALALRYTQSFPASAVPRRREVIEFLRSDHGLRRVARSLREPLRIDKWVTGSQSMRPIPAASMWAVPPITTVGALAEWMQITYAELQWFADLKGLGYKHPQERLEHYHYHALVKAREAYG